jgi:uncharacterized RDD family membrane protein YckC
MGWIERDTIALGTPANIRRSRFRAVARVFRACDAGRVGPLSEPAATLDDVAVPEEETYPGQRLGLPPEGRGSLASWGSRVAALILDWAACMAVAVILFGTPVLTGSGWRAWMILATFFVQSSLLVTAVNGSFGQLVCRIAVVRVDREPVGLLRAVLRAALVSLALPPLVVGADRRGLQDLAANTVVVSRR